MTSSASDHDPDWHQEEALLKIERCINLRKGDRYLRALHNFAIYRSGKMVAPLFELCTSQFWVDVDMMGHVASLCGEAADLVQAGYWDIPCKDRNYARMHIRGIIGMYAEKEPSWHRGEHEIILLQTQFAWYAMLSPSPDYAKLWGQAVASWQEVFNVELWKALPLQRPLKPPSWWQTKDAWARLVEEFEKHESRAELEAEGSEVELDAKRELDLPRGQMKLETTGTSAGKGAGRERQVIEAKEPPKWGDTARRGGAGRGRGQVDQEKSERRKEPGKRQANEKGEEQELGIGGGRDHKAEIRTTSVSGVYKKVQRASISGQIYTLPTRASSKRKLLDNKRSDTGIPTGAAVPSRPGGDATEASKQRYNVVGFINDIDFSKSVNILDGTDGTPEPDSSSAASIRSSSSVITMDANMLMAKRDESKALQSKSRETGLGGDTGGGEGARLVKIQEEVDEDAMSLDSDVIGVPASTAASAPGQNTSQVVIEPLRNSHIQDSDSLDVLAESPVLRELAPGMDN